MLIIASDDTPKKVEKTLGDYIVEDFCKLNRKERKLVYRFTRAVISRNKEDIKYLVELLEHD